jgi:hypothetical protein
MENVEGRGREAKRAGGRLKRPDAGEPHLGAGIPRVHADLLALVHRPRDGDLAGVGDVPRVVAGEVQDLGDGEGGARRHNTINQGLWVVRGRSRRSW